MCEVLDRIENRGIQKGIEQGRAQGIEQGEDKLALLMSQLVKQNRITDIAKASEDRAYRADLMREFGIK